MSRYLYFSIDERGRIVELRVTRGREDRERRPALRYGRSMSRDLSGSHLWIEDLPPSYAEPVKEHVGRTGEREGIVEIPTDRGEVGESGSGDREEGRREEDG